MRNHIFLPKHTNPPSERLVSSAQHHRYIHSNTNLLMVSPKNWLYQISAHLSLSSAVRGLHSEIYLCWMIVSKQTDFYHRKFQYFLFWLLKTSYSILGLPLLKTMKQKINTPINASPKAIIVIKIYLFRNILRTSLGQCD